MIGQSDQQSFLGSTNHSSEESMASLTENVGRRLKRNPSDASWLNRRIVEGFSLCLNKLRLLVDLTWTISPHLDFWTIQLRLNETSQGLASYSTRIKLFQKHNQPYQIGIESRFSSVMPIMACNEPEARWAKCRWWHWYECRGESLRPHRIWSRIRRACRTKCGTTSKIAVERERSRERYAEPEKSAVGWIQ